MSSVEQNHTDIDVLGSFWIRGLGTSIRFTKFQKLEDLPLCEQLFSAMLRCDKTAIERKLRPLPSDQTLTDLKDLIIHSGFCRLVLANLVETETIQVVPDSLRAQLTEGAVKETTNRTHSDQIFHTLLTMLSPICDQIIWIKGTSLSRSIYQGDEQRPSGDFDLVVHPSKIEKLFEILEANEFSEALGAAHCNQLYVGPVNPPYLRTLVPHPLLVPSSICTATKCDWPPLDIKLGPLDRGLQMYDLPGFFSKAESERLSDQTYWRPSHPDHLLICLHTFAKDRFKSWRTLYDIHSLAKLVSSENSWNDFLRDCHAESLELVSWAGLVLANNRLNTPVPDTVLQQLSPTSHPAKRFLAFTASPYFVWNATSFPMMLLNALSSTDKDQKIQILRRSFFPPDDFLREYYNHGKQPSAMEGYFLLLLHWLVLFLPGGLVRKTFGPFVWQHTAPNN